MSSTEESAGKSGVETERGITGGQLVDMVVQLSHRIFGPEPGSPATASAPSATPSMGASETIQEEEDDEQEATALGAVSAAAGLLPVDSAVSPVPAPAKSAPPLYGYQTFHFTQATPLGVSLSKKSNKKASKRAVLVDDVLPNTQASGLGIPIGAAITSVNGRTLKADELWDLMIELAPAREENRPLVVVTYLEKPREARLGMFGSMLSGRLSTGSASASS